MRLIKKLSGILTVFSIFTSLSACTANPINNSYSVKEIKIGVTLYKQDDAFISTITKNIEDIAKEKESNSKYKITIDVVDAKGSSSNQSNQVDKFVSQNYDIICVNLVDRTAASMIIDKAKLANIPIVFFNREPVEEDMQRWNKLYYVGAQAEQSGEMQANIIVNAYKKDISSIDKNGDGKIQYVMIEGEPGHQDSSIRTEYCIKTITQNGIELEKLADDTANWQSAQASTKMTQWIKEFGDKIEVVFSNNDDMALGAINAINNANIIGNKPLVVGIDGIPKALEAVKNGSMIGTIINDSKAQAKAIFDISYTLATHGNMNSIEGLEKGKYIRTSHTEVTSDNVDLYLENK
ncbi:galactose ABC transporter substrate-binding protein [Clostridium gelidum]|uniref:D-galactose/methyl-galactoside binding periplasmic protein MglB n=1 Tax=Clostridium gelidum TaxID=704125 RepID=A0ABM7TBS4_9CLOT|nr:galactose ABC transporter substrate-binding protein [Clostridium gelidum]BCZ48772.1 galactose ABC transporter substrate-binding protein [Clostridium gelidum]